MVIRRGEVWWAALAPPVGSGPGFRRPVLVIQADEFNDSAIHTVVCAVITSNLRLAAAPGNVLISRRMSKLPSESVVNISQLLTLDKSLLAQRVGRLPPAPMREVEAGLKLILSL